MSDSLLQGFRRFDPLADSPSLIPDLPGNYILVMRDGCSLPNLGTDLAMREVDGLRVIYTGISKKSLGKRIGHDHLKGHSSFSTLRISLGCLSGFPLIPRDRIPDGKHFRFSPEDEKSLSSWMRQNLVFYFKPNDEYAMMEDLLIALFTPPLNLDKNENPVNGAFRDRLKALRRNRP
jgi:hypothetical protein